MKHLTLSNVFVVVLWESISVRLISLHRHKQALKGERKIASSSAHIFPADLVWTQSVEALTLQTSVSLH